ncbi:Exocyst complex component 7 [Sarcoptes scabiei]|uniref:Exocyst complex component 7 n=1 Tax=Sarcoptes scabiei TaxID=52283 RepID=A0A834VHQ8_SARSC|nr:Exocyst complex component 7 [Sarcoptes scabiei]
MEFEDDRRRLVDATNNLTNLKKLLSFSSENCFKVFETLTKFDERLAKLEETVQPVYKETGNLQRQQENINSTLSRLDYVIKFYTVAGEVEPNIINRPNSPSMYEEYIRDLNLLAEAVGYFENNNPDSPELMNCGSLLEKGGQIIEQEFQHYLCRFTEDMRIEKILELIKSDSSMEMNEKSSNENFPIEKAEFFCLFKSVEKRAANPDKIVRDLKSLAEWLCLNRNQSFVHLYSKLRSDVLTRSLQNFRSFLLQSSLESLIKTLGSQLSPMLGGRKNSHLMKIIETSSKQLNDFHKEKNRNSFIRRKPESSSETFNIGGYNSNFAIPQSTSSHSLGSNSFNLENSDSLIREKEIFVYVLMITTLLKLAQIELNLLENIVPISNQKNIFSLLITSSLESIHQEGDQLSSRVKKAVQKHEFNSALNLLPVLRYLAHVRHHYDILLDGCNPSVLNRLHSLVVTLQTTISRTLEEFLEYIKSDMHIRVPKDGTVHELTCNVMLFLVHLQSYLDILSRVVTVTDIQSLELSGDKNSLAFAQYICRVLSALGLSLRKRSESYHNDPCLQSLFRLNNTFYILKTLRNSSLMSIVLLYKNDIEIDLMDQIRDFKTDYQRCWSKVIQYITDEDGFHSNPTSFQSYSSSNFQNGLKETRLKDKERQLIKDKFSGFNKEFEAVINAHKYFSIPDKDLRENLKQEHIELIGPLYHAFYNRYVTIDFTKNVHKYIKYTPDHVVQSIVVAFDDLA